MTRYRVLLVEDHEPLAEVTAAFMESEGLEVRIASTGTEALEMAAAFQPEIVLCDMRLPDTPGLEVAKQLRKTLRSKPVIAMHTAFSESVLDSFESDDDQAVDMFLSKPVTKEKLAALVAKV